MPSWKRVVVSGSDATLNSLFVSNAVTASIFSGSFIGNLTGTASYVSGNIYTSANPALSASYALTSSYSFYSLTSQTAVTSSYPFTSVGKNTLLAFSQSGYGLQLTGSVIINPGDSTTTWSSSEAHYSTFIGEKAGYRAFSASFSNFIGVNAGEDATRANSSNFIGFNAGRSAPAASDSNFLGSSAGLEASGSQDSNFLGNQAGLQASSSYQSNFLGRNAGNQAKNAHNSNFLGSSAGIYSTNASNSNFLGNGSGFSASNSNNSNFLGNQAGYQAVNANSSNFLGSNAGYSASAASYSNLFGFQTGYKYLGSSGIGSNNIIIGTNITLPDNSTNRINLGGLIFGSGTNSTVGGNPFSGSMNGAVGINQPNPQYSLDVSGSGNYTNGLTVTGSVKSLGGFTGSLLGTASYVTGALFTSANPALSASYALTASYALSSSAGGIGGSGTANRVAKFTAGTTIGDSRILDDGTNIQITGSNIIVSGASTAFIVTGSVRSSGGFTGSLFGTASWASNVISAQTASFVNNLRQNLVVTGSVIFSGSTAPELIVIGDAVITGSVIMSGSTGIELRVIGDTAITGSVTLSGSAGIELKVVGDTVVTGSLVVSGANGAGIFSQGATLVDYSSGISNSGSYMVWRAPFSCSVVALYGWYVGGTAPQVNASRSGSSGFGRITGSNITLNAANVWLAATASGLQNRDFNNGDSLLVVMSGSANNQLAVQVDFIRKF